MTNKNFSDDSFDKIFDVTPLRNSIKNNSIAKYILFFLLIFGILSISTTIILNYNNQEEELE
jgi:uncharacterized BrkB/YihY/UPF0761 family membrane protein